MTLRSTLNRTVGVALLSLLLAACSTSTSVQVSQPPPQVGATISKDTLRGTLKGTLVQGHTYYMDSNVVVAAGDTLLIQPGVTVIVLNTGISNAAGAPEFQVYGTFISAGSKDQPVYLTVAPNLRKYTSLTDVNSGALWGGIQCAAPKNGAGGSGDLILKWTHVEFAGGSAGTNDPIVTGGGARYAIWFQNPSANFIMEDSWLTGSTDDPLRVSGGKIGIFRNVIECAAPTSGDFNMKSGTVGDIAYNLFVGVCTNGPKLANTGGINPECNVNIYNNTIVTCGWRCTKDGRAGSTDIEGGARGIEYNNLIVNSRTGFRLVGGSAIADTGNTFYDYQYYYGAADSVVKGFYPVDGIQGKGKHDVAGTAGQNDPMFVGYSVTQVPTNLYVSKVAFSSQQPVENLMRTMDEKGNQRFNDLSTSFKSDFHLQQNSPCVGKAYTGTVKGATGSALPVPMAVVPQKSASNPFGAEGVVGLGKDFGAYQMDGSGNQQ